MLPDGRTAFNLIQNASDTGEAANDVATVERATVRHPDRTYYCSGSDNAAPGKAAPGKAAGACSRAAAEEAVVLLIERAKRGSSDPRNSDGSQL